MPKTWSTNLRSCIKIVSSNVGPELIITVSGSELDRLYWADHFAATKRDIFRSDARTDVVSVSEPIKKGNFLGTLNAWRNTRSHLISSMKQLPQVSLMSMVFGKGKRLSPFSQALGERKPAFPTPFWGERSDSYLRMADVSNLYSNLLVQHLSDGGFRGCLIKWSDEAMVPGILWNASQDLYAASDAVRLMFRTDVTEDLAREKEWIGFDTESRLMQFQYARQESSYLRQRLAKLNRGSVEVGLNLGSFAISYDFLEEATTILGLDLDDPNLWLDWDPYVWIALFCRDRTQWQAEIATEDRFGMTGIRQLEARYPNFFDKIHQIRMAVEAKTNRPFTVHVLDFGEPLWSDFGLHVALRKSMELLTHDTTEGRYMRELFGIPSDKDESGNIVMESHLPRNAKITNSVIINSTILDEHSIVNGGVVVGSRHRRLDMPYGGSSLFCAVGELRFDGPRGIAFRLLADDATLPEGGRYTSLILPNSIEQMRSNEMITNYDGENYTQAILGNKLSFDEAARIMSNLDGKELETRWFHLWQNWPI